MRCPVRERMTDGHSTALGSAPSSRHFLWGPPRLGGSPGPAARARACCAMGGDRPPSGRRGCAQPLHHLARVQVRPDAACRCLTQEARGEGDRAAVSVIVLVSIIPSFESLPARAGGHRWSHNLLTSVRICGSPPARVSLCFPHSVSSGLGGQREENQHPLAIRGSAIVGGEPVSWGPPGP